MANPQFLRNVQSGDNEFVKFAILQSWLEEACINAGISLTPLSTQQVLDEVRAGDTDLQKWQKVTSWAQQLATGIGGGGGASVLLGSGTATLANSRTQAILFGVTIPNATEVSCDPVIPSGGGASIFANVVQGSITSTGFTVQLSAPPGDTSHILTWRAFSQ